MTQNPFDFSDLASTDAEIAAATRKGDSKRVVEFDCVECGGTGLWQSGRVNVHGNKNCWTCGGRGKVKTDPAKLKANRIKAAQKKTDTLEAFRAEHADVIAVIRGATEWSTFAESLYVQLASKVWSDKQLAAARSMAAKLVAKEQARKAQAVQQVAAAPVVDLSAIKAMFDAAVTNGYKAPKYRAEGLALSRAADHSSNPGCLYVKSLDSDEYLGKILPDLRFVAVRSAPASTEASLLAIAADPLGAAVRYGQRTGRCACCGRELTNDVSITRGIGPICADKWGLGDFVSALTKEEAKAELDALAKDLRK